MHTLLVGVVSITMSYTDRQSKYTVAVLQQWPPMHYVHFSAFSLEFGFSSLVGGLIPRLSPLTCKVIRTTFDPQEK